MSDDFIPLGAPPETPDRVVRPVNKIHTTTTTTDDIVPVGDIEDEDEQ